MTKWSVASGMSHVRPGAQASLDQFVGDSLHFIKQSRGPHQVNFSLLTADFKDLRWMYAACCGYRATFLWSVL